MKSPFSDLTDAQVRDLVIGLQDGSYLSRRDGCSVTLVKCAECARMFEEELDTAKAKVISRVGFLCLTCDAEAKVEAFRGLVVQIGWFTG